MASEATSEKHSTSSISPDELNTIETPSQDVTSEQTQPVVNGTSEIHEDKPDHDNVEAIVNSAEGSVSGGSDTEASKAETKTQGDEKGHSRTTSTVKKFASFKPVSVNKTFLAAKGTTTATPSKLGDKGVAASTTTPAIPSTSSAPRPRLVAKSGSGLRDSAPRNSAAANGGKAGAAPDASAVWNKNRPAPPAEPKRFTDEELKQRYGIHLATRLQSDDPGKQANWADIDDDDDDWAPETIEWTDGTKITLPQADETPAPIPEPTPVPVKETKIAEVPKSISPAPPQASASPTVKSSGLGTGRAGLILKGATEKPTLVAKPPGPPTPVKSPWAPLPPVDKVAPIAIEIPQQQPSQSRFSQRDPHGFQGMPPPPAKEIAADDFSRSSWREGSNTSRELYNSQSGRYEPVNDSRRGSNRNDARGHQPAVLQRPSPQDGPAEPSPAFQTHHTSGQDRSYGRRRTSSNVSGGSGNFIRRMSRGHDMPPPHEMLNVRRGSLAAVSDSPSSPRNYSPSGQHQNQNQNQRGYPNQQWQQSRASPVISHPSPQSTHGQIVPAVSTDAQPQATNAVYEDPVETQKKIMRQTRELAIKRRQEEEAKEEAARKERIRIKLEAMGPPPDTKKKKDAPKEDKPSPTQIQGRDEGESVTPQPESSSANDKLKVTLESTEPSLAKPVEKVSAEKSPVLAPDSRIGDMRQGPPNSNAQHAPENRSSQSWQNASTSSSDRFKSWSAASSQQSTSRNVWGPPTNDRTLGNGTFNPELSRIPDMHQGPHPGPIGPPNSARGSSQLQQGHGREYGSRPAPIGPPNKQGMSRQELNRAAVASSGWGSLPDRIAQDDALLAQQQDAEITRRRELQDKGLEPEVNTVINETWRQVNMNEDGTRGKLQGKVPAMHDPTQPWKQQEEPTTRGVFEEPDMARRNVVANHAQQFDAWRPPPVTASPPVRGSRFFPNNRDVRLEEQPALFDRPGSPSPPPPTMAGHPAYDGDTSHPQVLLPRPSPVVKLPPPPVLAPIGPPKPTSFAAAVQAPVVPVVNHITSHTARQDLPPRGSQYQDIRRQEPPVGGWQERINSLIGRNTSPPKSHALAVDSSSKNALEVPHPRLAATVSLPSLASGSATGDGTIESKPAAEECFEEQEMGSLPIIKVPVSAPISAWSLAPPQPKSLPRKFHVSHTTSAEAIHFPQQIANNNSTVTIKVPGQEESRNVSVPVPRQRSNPRRGGSRGGNPRPRGRGRDGSNGFASPNPDNASNTAMSNSGRGGRGGRGYGAAWSRHVSTPVHT